MYVLLFYYFYVLFYYPWVGNKYNTIYCHLTLTEQPNNWRQPLVTNYAACVTDNGFAQCLYFDTEYLCRSVTNILIGLCNVGRDWLAQHT